MFGSDPPVLDDIEQFAHAESVGATDKRSGSRQNPVLRTILRLGIPIEASSVSHFRIRKVCEGSRHALIVVNGFLSKGSEQIHDWQHGLSRRYHASTIYHVDWEATRCPSSALQDLVTLPGARNLLSKTARTHLWDVVSAWHRSMVEAQRAGDKLSRAISSTQGWSFTLAGHSLGARVVYYALKDLAVLRPLCIEDVYLLGGAVGGGPKDDDCWGTATRAVKGSIFNCHSTHDRVLRWAYRNANLRMSEPIGLSGINLRHASIVNHDCSGFLTGHTDWKNQLGTILRSLDVRGRRYRCSK